MFSGAGRHLGRGSLLDHKLAVVLPGHGGDEELSSDQAVCLSVVGGVLDTPEEYAGPTFQTPELSSFRRCISQRPSGKGIIARERRPSAGLPRFRRSLR